MRPWSACGCPARALGAGQSVRASSEYELARRALCRCMPDGVHKSSCALGRFALTLGASNAGVCDRGRLSRCVRFSTNHVQRKKVLLP